jgi:hypothetical protein
MNIEMIQRVQGKPEPFTPGEAGLSCKKADMISI